MLTATMNAIVAPAWEQFYPNALVRATATDGYDLLDVPATVSGTTLTATSFASNAQHFNHRFDPFVKYYPTFTLNWQLSVDDGAHWSDLATSINPIYVTLKPPVNPAQLYETVLQIGTEAANGDISEAGVIDDVWGVFETREVYTAWGADPLIYNWSFANSGKR